LIETAGPANNNKKYKKYLSVNLNADLLVRLTF